MQTRTLQLCAEQNMVELSSLDTSKVFQPDPYEQFYKNVFGDLLGTDIVLPTDYKETVEYFLTEWSSEKERKVIECRLGIRETKSPMTLEKIAEEMGMSRGGVGRIESKFYEKIKKCNYRSEPSCRSKILKMGVAEYKHQKEMKELEEEWSKELRKKEKLEEENRIKGLNKEKLSEEELAFRNTPLSEFEMSTRLQGCLWRTDIHTVGDLLAYNTAELTRIDGFGPKCGYEADALIEKLIELLNLIQEK